MIFFDRNNNLLIGLALGACMPVLGYLMVEFIFETLTNAGIMDEVSISTSARRQRTMALIALCFNIITVQFFKKRKYTPILNGIVTATIVYAILWVLLFKVL
jgi:hypothetical protein